MRKAATIAILLFLVGFTGYYLIETNNSYSATITGAVVQESFQQQLIEIEDDFSKIEETHWGEMPIKYFIKNEKECGNYESDKIEQSFNEIEEDTNSIVSFIKVNNSEDSDINLFCSFLEDCYNIEYDVQEHWTSETETICAHKLGTAEIKEISGNLVEKAEIELFGLGGFSETGGRGMSGFYVGTCGHTDPIIHEILHTLGFGHSSNPKSIMFSQMESNGYRVGENQCKGSKIGLGEEYIACLKYIYSNGKIVGDCNGLMIGG